MALRFACAASGIGCALLLLTSPLLGQEAESTAPRLQVGEARARIEVSATGVRVILEYGLSNVAGDLALEGVRFDGVALEGGRVGPENATRVLDVTHDELGYGATVGPGDIRDGRLRIEYRVAPSASAEGLAAAVPVLVPDAVATEARRDYFEGDVALPDGFKLTESFPSQARRSEDSHYRMTLPVVPGLIRLRALPMDQAGLGFVWWVEGTALALVLLLTWQGWRHLEREV